HPTPPHVPETVGEPPPAEREMGSHGIVKLSTEPFKQRVAGSIPARLISSAISATHHSSPARPRAQVGLRDEGSATPTRPLDAIAPGTPCSWGPSARTPSCSSLPRPGGRTRW